MIDDTAAIARLLRRTGFGPGPGDLDRWSSYGDAVAGVLASGVDDGAEMPDANDDDLIPPIRWWVRRMLDGVSPLYEKMVLFWHSTITSSADKAGADMMVRQHNLLRRHALGNYRHLLKAIVRDAAMLVFLDAAESSAESPNENLARELMELFSLGRGNYGETDVKAAARVLAGFRVEWESEAVGFDEEAANWAPVTFLGITGFFDSDRLVDVICDQPACARFVVTRLHRFLAGVDPSDSRLDELAALFSGADLEIRPLVDAIVRDPTFADPGAVRPRFPIEWMVLRHRALGLDLADDDLWTAYDMGQLPCYPPNVAGWQVGPQWLSSGRQLLRASVAVSVDTSDVDVRLGGGSPPERAIAALARCGIVEASAATRAGLELAASRFASDDDGDALVTLLALASPEAALC